MAHATLRAAFCVGCVQYNDHFQKHHFVNGIQAAYGNNPNEPCLVGPNVGAITGFMDDSNKGTLKWTMAPDDIQAQKNSECRASSGAHDPSKIVIVKSTTTANVFLCAWNANKETGQKSKKGNAIKGAYETKGVCPGKHIYACALADQGVDDSSAEIFHFGTKLTFPDGQGRGNFGKC